MRTRVGLGAALAVIALLGVSCDGGDDGGDGGDGGDAAGTDFRTARSTTTMLETTTTTTAPPQTTVTTAAPAPEEEILAAYAAYWDRHRAGAGTFGISRTDQSLLRDGEGRDSSSRLPRPLPGSAAMTITITRRDSGYFAHVTPPESKRGEWTTPAPMELENLIARLRELGCHQTDIGDALYAADPGWLERE